jgi:DNA topoisomerase-1
MSSLVVVESPTKARTIKRILGRGFVVVSSMGHLKDLPKARLGVDVENGFKPEYITIRGKGPVLKKLKDAARNADRIFIATDPDREGEAIAYHIARELKNKHDLYRVLFFEITPGAVKDAIASPGAIDEKKVDAQQARRILDRLVGYKVSPLLWKTVRRGLSAGRVQTVALRMICEREKEIEDFVPQEYWDIFARLSEEKGQEFTARLVEISKEKPEIGSEKEAEAVTEKLMSAGLIRLTPQAHFSRTHPEGSTSRPRRRCCWHSSCSKVLSSARGDR